PLVKSSAFAIVSAIGPLPYYKIVRRNNRNGCQDLTVETERGGIRIEALAVDRDVLSVELHHEHGKAFSITVGFGPTKDFHGAFDGYDAIRVGAGAASLEKG